MFKPIVFSFSVLLLCFSCGNKPLPEQKAAESTSMEVIPEKVDGPITSPDTLVQTPQPSEKTVEEKVTTPPQKTTEKPKSEKPGKPVLHGSWVLEKVNGAKEPFNMLFPNKAPDIQFDLKTNTISGNNGCNSYNGPFTLKNGILTFGGMVSTRMYCEGVNEYLFMTTLKLANNYEIDDNLKLHLRLDEEDLLIFKSK